jgi:hypothetical protein
MTVILSSNTLLYSRVKVQLSVKYGRELRKEKISIKLFQVFQDSLIHECCTDRIAGE